MFTNARSIITSLKPRPKLKYIPHRRNGPFILAKRYLSRRLWAWRNRNRPSLLDLPVDVLLLIFPLLPLVSQSCLALTCRPLYDLFGHVLQDESLAWPRQLASKGYMILVHQLDIPRNQLLSLLEDDYWLYCSTCLKIHPQSRFTLSRWYNPPQTRWCEYSMKGILDLCPCLSLTFFDRVRLEECLRRGILNPGLPRSVRQAFRLAFNKSQRFLIHECSINDHANAFISLKTTISLQGRDDLIFQTRYRIHLNRPRSFPRSNELGYRQSFPHFGMEPVLCCAHFDVLESIYRPNQLQHACRLCGTIVIETWRTVDELCVVVECSRNLGGVTGEINWLLGGRDENDAYYRTWYLHHGAHV